MSNISSRLSKHKLLNPRPLVRAVRHDNSTVSYECPFCGGIHQHHVTHGQAYGVRQTHCPMMPLLYGPEGAMMSIFFYVGRDITPATARRLYREHYGTDCGR